MNLRRILQTPLPALGLLLLLPTVVRSADEPNFSPDELTFFEEQVRPLLVDKCLKCHGGEETEGSLNLTARSGLVDGGDSGPAIDVDDPAASLLLEAINYESFEMPPTGKLPQEEIDLLTRWVKLRAPMPAEGIAIPQGDAPHRSPEVNDETKQHWSFQPVARPDVPMIPPAEAERDGTSWTANPIDAFVLSKLLEAGLEPAPPADRQTLIRRVYYDLIGLPPTPEQVEAFITDASPDAYEKLVDELLESPQHGEHWARYWLDLVRYAESNSFERDDPKPYIWRYRDYVIRAFNNDVPYDQFVLEQLAGDELDDVTPTSIIATGYYRLGLWDDEPADPKLAFFDGLDDIAATTSQALLGLSMNCARCHEHKLDPISHADYHRFIAFFRNIKHYGVRSEASVYEHSIREVDLPEEREQNAARVAAWERQLNEIKGVMGGIESEALQHLEGGEKDDFQDQSARYDILKRRAGEIVSKDQFEKYEQLKKQREDLEKNPPSGLAHVLSIKEQGADPPPTHILLRGNPHSEGDEVQPGFPEVLSPPEPDIQPPADGQSSGRRRAFAEWIVAPDNPLTARVMVNRLWQWHFGRGLVRSANNFGLQGDPPTHPQLLDWLAAEFVSRGWSLKSMHRLMLTSNTYRMASRAVDDAATARGHEIDPTNDLYWRFDMRRLRAEEVRDSILAVNGTLNDEKMYGPSMYPVIPPEVLAGQSRPGHGWEDSPESERRRRSIYIHIKRSLRVPILADFDVADTEFTCPVRFATTQPTQALGLLNSTWSNEQASHFADLLRHETGDNPAAQVTLALRRTLQREPTTAEVERGLKLMHDLQSDHDLSPEDALHYFCLTALNLNEFLYLD